MKHLLILLLVFSCITLLCCNKKIINLDSSNHVKRFTFASKTNNDGEIDRMKIQFAEMIEIKAEKKIHIDFAITNKNRTDVNLFAKDSFKVTCNENKFFTKIKISDSPKEKEDYQEIANQVVVLIPDEAIYFRVTLEDFDYEEIKTVDLNIYSPLSDKSIQFSFVVE